MIKNIYSGHVFSVSVESSLGVAIMYNFGFIEIMIGPFVFSFNLNK